MKRNNLFLIIIVFLPTLLFSSCDDAYFNSILDSSNEVLECFLKKDSEKMLLLLSDSSRKLAVGENSPEAGFDFISGDILSYDPPEITGGGGKLVEKGKVISENHSTAVKNIITTTGAKYSISMQYFKVSSKGPAYEGLNTIVIFSEDKKDSKGFPLSLQIGWH